MSFEAFTSSELYGLPKDCVKLVEQFVRPRAPCLPTQDGNEYVACWVCGASGGWAIRDGKECVICEISRKYCSFQCFTQDMSGHPVCFFCQG